AQSAADPGRRQLARRRGAVGDRSGRNVRRPDRDAPSMTPLAPGTMVVSCQADPGNPLDSPAAMALMAQAAEAGGAGAIRANGPADIAAIRAVTSLPIIGLHKLGDPAGVFITPTYEA